MKRARRWAVLSSDLALIGVTALILVVTLTPTHETHEIHLRPLRDITAAFDPSLDLARLIGVIGNVLLFIPFGVLMRARGVTRWRTVVLGLALSVCIEATQLLVPGRTTSVDDVFLNTVGALLGFQLAALGHVQGSE